MHAFDGSLPFGGAAHGHEAEAAGTTGEFVHHYDGIRDRAELFESGLEFFLARLLGQISDIEFHTRCSAIDCQAAELFPGIGFQITTEIKLT